MKLDDGRLTFVAQQEVTALDAIHKAVLGKAACAGRVTEGVGTCISIHAPTWGATGGQGARQGPLRISIHAPTWGATRRPRSRATSTGHFNPRTHVGCDGHPFIAAGPGDGISIHAPTWGATYGRVRVGEHRLISIHAPTWGATIGDVHMLIEINISIHAPTWGATKKKV